MDDPNRGTGRSTILMLLAIKQAAMSPGKEIEFVDHYKHTYATARTWQKSLTAIAAALNLQIAVRRDGSRVFVKANNNHK